MDEILTELHMPDVLARKPAVLIGIVTHNRAGILPKAIQSALFQKYPCLHIAVHDDGSNDGTLAVQSAFSGVQWKRGESVCGYLNIRNQFMRTTEADYYLSLDDDAWFLDGDEVATAVAYLESQPGVAAVAFDILSPDRPQRAIRTSPHRVATFIGCGHIVRMSAARDVGLYTPSPGLYGAEEKDLCIRLRDRDWDVHLLPGVHVWHEKSAAARDLPAQHRSGVCNDLVFALRRCPFPMVLAVLPMKVWKHLRFALSHRLLAACVGGFAMLLRNLPSVLRSRHPVRPATFREFMRQSRQTI